LPDAYVVFHDFALRRDEHQWHDWNIDHIVVGPTGVFVLETKNYSGKRVPSASHDGRTRDNVKQAQRNALDLKDRLVTWSGGSLRDVFVEGWVVYAQHGASVESLGEGFARVVPLRLLVRDIQNRPKRDVDWDRTFRITQALCTEMPEWKRAEFKSVLEQIATDHKARVATRIEEAGARRQTQASVESTPHVPEAPSICPLCGAPLVRRVASRGERKGRPFLGCSNWRERGCKFIHNLDEPAA
jgi:hypothetical protein